MMDVLTPGLGQTPLAYDDALRLQRALHAERVADVRADTLLLLEHPSTYTAGRLTRRAERPTDGTPVVEVDRGGRITWHGPGQLVGYPIVRLAQPIDVVAYVRRLELAIIRLLAEFDLTGLQIPGRSGVWLDGGSGPRKIAAIGVRVVSACTLHGFALNCSNDLAPFERIVPCGIADAGVTSMSQELGRTVTPSAVAQRLAEILTEVLADVPLERADRDARTDAAA